MNFKLWQSFISSMDRSVRCFVAVELPDWMSSRISDIQTLFKGMGLKLVAPENVHITLKFLGDVKPSKVPCIIESLGKVHARPFHSIVKGVGVFPKISRPRVVWLGAEGDYKSLHDGIDTVLSGQGFPMDRRKFQSHATLARVRSLPAEKKEFLVSLLDSLKEFEVGEFEVDHFTLMQSELTPRGPIYTKLQDFDLS